MIQTSIPTIEQLLGQDARSVVKEDYVKAYPTDLSILLGAEKHYGNSGTIYMTRTACPISGAVRSINANSDEKLETPWCRSAIRLVVPAAEVARLKGRYKVVSENVVVWGEYPQTALKWGFEANVAESLSAAYRQGKLKQTGKCYTFERDYRPLRYRICPEYKYKNAKYICLPAVCVHPNSGASLPQGGYVAHERDYWVKVEPVRWLRDAKTGDWISEKTLSSFIMTEKGDYDGYFRTTPLARYLRQAVDVELLPTKAYLAVKQMREKKQAQFKQLAEEKSRAEVRKVFAGLRGEDQMVLADILATDTPERKQTAIRLRKCRSQAYDKKTQAEKNLEWAQNRGISYNEKAQETEETGKRLLLEYQRKATSLRRKAKADIARAKRQVAQAIRVSDQARRDLAAYWTERRTERGART